METPAVKSQLDEYLDDLWETCDFPRPKQPRASMKTARLRAAKENELKECDESVENGNGEVIDKLDPSYYRSVTQEIRKIRGERASDRNIEWIINREAAKTNEAPKLNNPVKLQSVRDMSSEHFVVPLPTKPPINVQSRRDFPELK